MNSRLQFFKSVDGHRWENSEFGQMIYDNEKNWYQFVRYTPDAKHYEVNISERNTENCPVIVKGIIAYRLQNYGGAENHIFDSYYIKLLNKYKQIESVKSGSSLRNLDSDFHNYHLETEKELIDYSQKLASYLNDEELGQLNHIADAYLLYVKKEYAHKKTENESVDTNSGGAEESKYEPDNLSGPTKKYKIPARYYALYHWIKIEMSIEKPFEYNDKGDYIRSEIEAYAR